MTRREGETFTGEIKRNINQAKDRWQGRKKDFEAIKNDTKFEKFLEDTEQKFDWTKDESAIKDAYVNFERTTKVTEQYQKLFESKLKHLAPDNAEIKNEIVASLIESAKNDPEEIRKMEKLIDQVKKNEVAISSQQDKIDLYKAKGGKEGIQEKIDTLRKANSKIGSFLARVGGGKNYQLAKAKAEKMYGITNPEQIKAELKLLTQDVKDISKLEKAKAKTKQKFAKERAAIFLDNDTAKKVQEKIAGIMETKLDNFGDIKTPEQASELKKQLLELRKNFLDERGPNTKKAAADLLEVDEENLDFINLTQKEFDQLDKAMDKFLEERIDDMFTELVSRTKPDKLQEEVDQYFKKAQFAGMTGLETRRKIYEALTKVKATMDPKDDKAVKLSLILARNNYQIV